MTLPHPGNNRLDASSFRGISVGAAAIKPTADSSRAWRLPRPAPNPHPGEGTPAAPLDRKWRAMGAGLLPPLRFRAQLMPERARLRRSIFG